MDLKKFRKDNALLQKDVADYLGVRVSFITNVERGRNKMPDARLDALLANNRGWDTSSLKDDGPAVTMPRASSEVAMLKAKVAELQERCDRYWALIEKLTNK